MSISSTRAINNQLKKLDGVLFPEANSRKFTRCQLAKEAKPLRNSVLTPAR